METSQILQKTLIEEKQEKARENLQKRETSVASLDEAMDSANLDEAMKNLLAMCDEEVTNLEMDYGLQGRRRIPGLHLFLRRVYTSQGEGVWTLTGSRVRRLAIDMAEYSGKALAYFNKTNNTDYKFENDGEIIHGSEDHSYAIHCNFTAKPETAPLMPGDFSSKLFFAEHMLILQPKPSLTCCTMLDGADCKNNCDMCPMGMICHPKTFQDGYKPPLD